MTGLRAVELGGEQLTDSVRAGASVRGRVLIEAFEGEPAIGHGAPKDSYPRRWSSRLGAAAVIDINPALSTNTGGMP